MGGVPEVGVSMGAISVDIAASVGSVGVASAVTVEGMVGVSSGVRDNVGVSTIMVREVGDSSGVGVP